MEKFLEFFSAIGTYSDPEFLFPFILTTALFFAIYFFVGQKETPEEKRVEERKTHPSPAPPAEPPSPETISAFSAPKTASAQKSQDPPLVSGISSAPPPAEASVAESVSAFSAPSKVAGETPETPPAPEVLETAASFSESQLPSAKEDGGSALSEPEEKDTVEKSFFSRLSLGLSKTRRGILGNLEAVFSGGKIDDDAWDEFEEILIMSDMGVRTTAKLREKVSSAFPSGGGDVEEITILLKKEILEILSAVEKPVAELSNTPTVFIVAGVNGVGKTTSIGKIAGCFTGSGKRVMVAAADTFRAAAVEQLGVWAERVGSDFLRGQTGADPSAVAYDAVQASVSRGMDLLIIDTAGRVHTKTGLMEELGKLRRVVSRELEGAPHETLLVLDATTGQNAVEQARTFSEAIGVTGIVLTKLDGTAKGGIIVAIAEELGIPVKYVGVGEGLGDLREFSAEEFTEALFAPERGTYH